MTNHPMQGERSAATEPESEVAGNPALLAAVRSSGLLDTSADETFDRITRLAVQAVRAPAAFISFIDGDRERYKSTCGVGEPLASTRELAGRTFSHDAVQSVEPLVIPDAMADPRYEDVDAVHSLGIGAYVGVPLVVGGEAIGALSAIDSSPREWTSRDVAALKDLAAVAQTEIERRMTTGDAQDGGRERQDDRADTILASISDAFFALDREWRFTYVNDRAQQLLARQREELLGRSLWEAFEPVVGSGFETSYRRAMATGQVVVFEEHYPPLDGWFEVRAYPSADGLSVYFQDVTERHAAEVQRAQILARAEGAEDAANRANAAKSEFLATMSHELRTPLNAILGYTNLLELEISGGVNPEQRLHLARLRASGEHLLTLVNDVLDISKLEAGEMTLASDVGKADDVVVAAMTLSAPAAETRGVRLVHVPPHADEVAYVGDEMRVRQILVNLVSNAVKFTDPGGKVRITTGETHAPPPHTRLTGEGPWASIEVCDTGIGIAPEYQATVFEPFKQVVAGRTRTRGGTGLGLAISRRLARQMGGDIVLASEPGVGSTFTVWLPAAGVNGGVDETGEERGARARRSASAHRVRGLAEIAEHLRDEIEGILETVVTRIRVTPLVRARVGRLTKADLEDHNLSFLANVIQSLAIVEQVGGIESDLMEDGMHIQAFIARAHGAQRARLDWTEPLLADEYAYLEEELAGRIGLLGMDDPDEGTLAIGIVTRLLMHARTASIEGFRAHPLQPSP
jgi:PAS domain S-box-containing protein